MADRGKQTRGYSPGRVFFFLDRDKSHRKVGVILTEYSCHCGYRAAENWLEFVSV